MREVRREAHEIFLSFIVKTSTKLIAIQHQLFQSAGGAARKPGACVAGEHVALLRAARGGATLHGPGFFAVAVFAAIVAVVAVAVVSAQSCARWCNASGPLRFECKHNGHCTDSDLSSARLDALSLPPPPPSLPLPPSLPPPLRNTTYPIQITTYPI